MRLEAWVNKTMPADAAKLARILRLDAGEVAAALPAVMPFFSERNGEIRCPELDEYKTHLEQRRILQAAGGKRGAELTNANKKKSRRQKRVVEQGVVSGAGNPPATLASYATATPTASVRVLSTTQPSTAKSNPSPLKELLAVDPWVKEYEAAGVDSAEAYRRASGK